jgi:SAM-dependent methyltransferase
MTEEFSYTGREELDQALHLPRYNRHIAGLFVKGMEPGQSLMDFGAGTGTIAALVREQAQAEKIVCVELDRDNIAALHGKDFVVVTDALFVPENSIDVVYSSNVLEHIEDDVAMLKTLHCRLKPGGRAIFWVPAFPCLWTAMDARVGHYRRYTRATITQAFREAGFTVEKCFKQDSLGFFVTLLFKLIGSRDGKVNNASLKIYDDIVFPVSRLCDTVCSRLFGKNVVIYARK